MLIDKLEAIRQRFLEVEKNLSDPDVTSDRKRFAALSREYKELQKLVEKQSEYQNVLSNLDHSKAVVQNEKDDEFREMAKLEMTELEQKKDAIEEEIRMMLIPADPEDSKNAVVEIRAGSGGDEASIFAGDLYR